MKKLFALISFVIYLNSFSQVPVDSLRGAEGANGKKTLIKALAAFANPESNKRNPARNIQVTVAKCGQV